MNLNTGNNLSLKNQREKLLELNQDLLFGVYSIKQQDESSIELEMLDDVLTCYSNQLDNLQGLEDTDITIINIGELRKGKVEILHGEKTNIQNPILLSSGVIEFVNARNKIGDINRHIITTLRDNGSADQSHRTIIGGRNSGNNLHQDLRREHIEESPFLGKDKKGNLALASIENNDESIKILHRSIQHYIKEKYLKKDHPNYEIVKNRFERNFPGIDYDTLPKVLNDIIEKKRVYIYHSKIEDSIPGLEDDIKRLSLGASKGRYHVFHDIEHNTIEYQELHTITGLSDDFIPLSSRPSRLYLESENQYPRAARVETLHHYVPVVASISNKIRNML
ncbi:hypothetical protein OAN96_00090 [Candidatus Gracilibacteria bacterium]|nr:hypothetical protein [Candidatus Gracilibacteria bacterium]